MEDFFYTYILEIGCILFSVGLYIYLEIIDMEWNIRGFIFGPLIIIPPLISIYSITTGIISSTFSQETIDILKYIIFVVLVSLTIWVEYKRKKLF